MPRLRRTPSTSGREGLTPQEAMKLNRTFVIILTLVSLSLGSSAGPGQVHGQTGRNGKVAEEVTRRERELSAATVRKDIRAMREIVGDDFAGVESSGRVIDKATFINDIESGGDDVQADVPEDMKVRVYGDVAVVTGKLTIKGVKRDGGYDLLLLFTDVWVRRGGRWQVVNYQATREPSK